MKKTRKVHLWIGLISSIFIFMESLTGLLMNEPWLIGQAQTEGMRGNFQPGQFNQGQINQNNGQNTGPMQGQVNGQTQSQGNGRMQGQENGQMQGQNGFKGNGQFQGQQGTNGNRNFDRSQFGDKTGQGSGSIMSTIRGLHEGRIGTTSIKWLIDLVAVAMMILTGTGIYLSAKILGAEQKRKKRQDDQILL